MANVLKMAKVHSIQVLHARGWSRQRIARELGIHRETGARYLQSAAGEPRDGPAGAAPAIQNRPNPPTGSPGPELATGDLSGPQNRPNTADVRDRLHRHQAVLGVPQ